MASTLTKFLKDGHGILASSPASNEQHVMEAMDVDSLLRPSEDLQEMLLSVLPSLESYLQANPVDFPSSAGQCGSLVLADMDSSSKSDNKTLIEPHLAPSTPPGASDVCFLPEHDGQYGHKSACQCRPGAPDVLSLCSPSNVSHRFDSEDCISILATVTSNQEDSRLNQLISKMEHQNQVNKRVSRHKRLNIRAHNLQRRLEAALGQHAVIHCDQQLEGLRAQGLNPGLFSADSELSHVDSQQHFPWTETHFTEIKELSESSRAVLRGLQKTLDSEATASSSSDDEPMETKAAGKYREPCLASPCFEESWLTERAELGSRWSWLQLRVAELEGRIQQLMKLHKNIRSTKGSVVLADSQPMTMWQMKDALWKEVAALSCTALDNDNEPCSPTHLLHNIERQSAQLSRIVKSLMPPLNLSPLSKPPQPWKDKGAFDSDVFVSQSSKRTKIGVRRRQLFKDDMSCVCSRTRPLVTYYKPKIFRLNSKSNSCSSKCSSSRDGETSGLMCCSCSSSEPVSVCSDTDSSSNGTPSSQTCSFNKGESSPISSFTKFSPREVWSQMPLAIDALPVSPVYYSRCTSTPLYNWHKYKHKKKLLGLSPIRCHGGLPREKRASQRRRKRRRRDSCTEDDDDALSYCKDSSDDMFEENFVLVSQKQNTREAAHRRHGGNLFNIDNIVIPVSLTKVEKLQYKDVLTPSWQVLNIQSSLEDEANSEKDKDEKIEILSDEVFDQRHSLLEQKEKMRWCFWRKRHSSSRLSAGNVREQCTSGEKNSVEWRFKQLDTEDQLNSAECLPQAPWKRRVFPLNDDEETALSSGVLQWSSDSTLVPFPLQQSSTLIS